MLKNKDKIKTILLHMLWIFPLAYIVMYFALLNYNINSTTLVLDGYILDQNLFRYMGESWLKQGIILYKDVFDHKGPLLFLIQGLISFIAPYPDLNLFKCILFINVCLTISLIYMCLRTHICRGYSILFSILTILCTRFAYTGNTCEEFTLPFMLVIIYLFLNTVKDWESISNKRLDIRCFFIGLCSMCIIMIRPNNVIPVVGLLAALIFLVGKDYKKTFKAITYAIFGALIPYAMFSSYFILNNAYPEFIEGTFGFSLSYVGQSFKTQTSIFKNLMEYLGYYFWVFLLNICLLFGIKRVNKKNETIFIISTLIFNVTNLLSIIIGINTVHYWWMFIPSYILGIILIFKYVPYFVEIKNLKIVYVIFAAVLLLSGDVFGDMKVSKLVIDEYHYKSNEGNLAYYEEIKDIGRFVKEQSQSKHVYGYNISPLIYFESNKIPAHRYWTFQELWMFSNYIVCEESVDYIRNVNEDNLVVIGDSYRVDGKFYCKGIDEVLEQQYTEIKKGHYLSVYRKN